MYVCIDLSIDASLSLTVLMTVQRSFVLLAADLPMLGRRLHAVGGGRGDGERRIHLGLLGMPVAPWLMKVHLVVVGAAAVASDGLHDSHETEDRELFSLEPRSNGERSRQRAGSNWGRSGKLPCACWRQKSKAIWIMG